MKAALCKADRKPTRTGVSKAPLDIRRKVYTGRRYSGRHDHCDKRLKGQRPVRWVIETCEVLCRESTLQGVRIQTRCDSRRDDGMDRLDHDIRLREAKGRDVEAGLKPALARGVAQA